MRKRELSDLSIEELEELKPGVKLVLLEDYTRIKRGIDSSNLWIFETTTVVEKNTTLTLKNIYIEEHEDDDGDYTGEYDIEIRVEENKYIYNDYQLALILGPSNFRGENYVKFISSF